MVRRSPRKSRPDRALAPTLSDVDALDNEDNSDASPERDSLDSNIEREQVKQAAKMRESAKVKGCNDNNSSGGDDVYKSQFIVRQHVGEGCSEEEEEASDGCDAESEKEEGYRCDINRRDETKPVQTVAGDRNVAAIDAVAAKARRRRVKTANDYSDRRGKNALSKLIPGYTAPLTLVPASLSSSSASAAMSVVDNLDLLRRKALQKELHSMQSTMQQQSTTACSFKTGRVPKAIKVAAKAATAGDGWFNMRPTPVTSDLEKDLAVIRNRNYLDPKRFYKSADKPKNKHMVQMGTVIEGAMEFYSSRLTKKQRRGNLADEILADQSLSGYVQNKYKSMQQEKQAAAMKRKKYKRRGGRR